MTPKDKELKRVIRVSISANGKGLSKQELKIECAPLTDGEAMKRYKLITDTIMNTLFPK